jgi:hypothetical protein
MPPLLTPEANVTSLPFEMTIIRCCIEIIELAKKGSHDVGFPPETQELMLSYPKSLKPCGQAFTAELEVLDACCI